MRDAFVVELLFLLCVKTNTSTSVPAQSCGTTSASGGQNT